MFNKLFFSFFVLSTTLNVLLADKNLLNVTPQELSIVLGDKKTIEYSGDFKDEIQITLNSTSEVIINPSTIAFSDSQKSAKVEVSGVLVTSRTFIDIQNCIIIRNSKTTNCPFNLREVYVRVKVVHSNVISALVFITGWIYFFAWSISFYPQIFLNYQRKSVDGLNFDFLLLNVISFVCYTIYNVMLFFDQSVQEIYIKTHLRSLIPVLLNDVVFAVHALFACVITGAQCFFYERGNQRISYICWSWSTILVTFSGVSFFITLFGLINWLQFINHLSYVKLAVTLSKYFPQAILNYKRKSTVGWSIGNIILDFLGGSMDICQMILQASNTNDWSAFYGNPVKFGLGFISIFFDIFFMIQHYGLYRNKYTTTPYDQVNDNNSNNASQTPPNSDVSA